MLISGTMLVSGRNSAVGGGKKKAQPVALVDENVAMGQMQNQRSVQLLVDMGA